MVCTGGAACIMVNGVILLLHDCACTCTRILKYSIISDLGTCVDNILYLYIIYISSANVVRMINHGERTYYRIPQRVLDPTFRLYTYDYKALFIDILHY